MKRFLALALVVAMIGLGVPMPANADASGQISGTALSADMQSLRSCTVRLRSLATGVVRDVTTLGARGSFMFTGLNTGSYMVELVNNGQVVGTSGEVTITPKSPIVTGVAVAAAGQGGAAAGGGSFFTSAAGIVLLAAVGVGVTVGIVKARGDSSPSK